MTANKLKYLGFLISDSSITRKIDVLYYESILGTFIYLKNSLISLFLNLYNGISADRNYLTNFSVRFSTKSVKKVYITDSVSVRPLMCFLLERCLRMVDSRSDDTIKAILQ